MVLLKNSVDAFWYAILAWSAGEDPGLRLCPIFPYLPTRIMEWDGVGQSHATAAHPHYFAAKFLLHLRKPWKTLLVCRLQICRTLRFLAEILINNWLSWLQNDWEMTWVNVCWKSSQTRRPGKLSFFWSIFAKAPASTKCFWFTVWRHCLCTKREPWLALNIQGRQ